MGRLFLSQCLLCPTLARNSSSEVHSQLRDLAFALQKKYRHLAGLPLQQMDRVQTVLLIGSDCPHLITPIEPVLLGPPGGPAAVKTRLGWMLQGPIHEIKHGLNVHQCLFTSVPPNSDLFAHVERLWQIDVVPYHSEKVVTRSKLDQEAIQLLQEKTTRVEVDGIIRYATPLFRVKNMPHLTMPKETVLPQLRSIKRKLLKKSDQASTYQAEISKLKEAGYAVKLEPSEILPGPMLSPSLLAVLLRFREHSIAVTSKVFFTR